jgi:N-acetylglucosamine-6-phosphate deacetylase
MSTKIILKNCRLYTEADGNARKDILIENGVITRVGEGGMEAAGAEVIDAGGRIACPGFIDVHIQGAGGADVLDATPESLNAISRACAQCGVTGFLATTVYNVEGGNRHLEAVAEYTDRELEGAALLGTHLEGPFISSAKKGMIQLKNICLPSAKVLADIEKLCGRTLSMMTIAPELPGSLDLIRELASAGTVASCGHTSASYGQTRDGIAAGLNHATHLFNAMPSLHHRDPGPLPALLADPNVTLQVITDGVHVHAAVVDLIYRLAGPRRIVTITDGMQALGLPDGDYVYNGIPYVAREGAARYHDGTLIGTALGLNQMAARLRRFTGCSLETAVDTVSRNPAEVLGLGKRKGRLQAGYDADIVIMDEDLKVWRTVVGGRVVYSFR